MTPHDTTSHELQVAEAWNENITACVEQAVTCGFLVGWRLHAA
jgi:hypothetical protein